MPGLADALPFIGAATGVASSILNPILQARENRKNREYNTPINQMARLKEAGLNPHLVYGNGANAQMPSQQAPQVDGDQIPRSLMLFMDFATKALEKDKLREQIDLIEAQRKLAEETYRNRSVDTENKALKLSFDSGLFATNTEYRKAQLRGLEIGNEGKTIQNAMNLERTDIMRLMKEPNLQKLLEETKMTQARRSMIPYQKTLLTEQAKNVASSTALNEVKRLSQEKQNAIFSDTHTLLLKNIEAKKGSISLMKANEDLLRTRQRWMDMGLSPTATQDLIETFTGKKFLDGLGKKKMSDAELERDWMRRGRERFEEIRRARNQKQ